MESLAPEVEPFGIHTMIVNPGFFRTELLTKESTNYAEPSIEDYAERNPPSASSGRARTAGSRRPGQARPGAADHRRAGAAAVPLHRRRRRDRAGRAAGRRSFRRRSRPSATSRRRSRSTRCRHEPRRGDHGRVLGHRRGDGESIVAAANRVQERSAARTSSSTTPADAHSPVRLRPARRAPAHGRDQPARRNDSHGGLPRPAPRERARRPGERLVGCRSRRARGLRRVRSDQVGDQRLVGGAARRASARHPRNRHRARRHHDRAHRSHHRPRQQASEQGSDGRNGHPAQDIADVIAFAVGRPQRVTLNEILVRPTAQAM